LDVNQATLAAYEANIATYLAKTPTEPSALARWLGSMAGDVFAPGARVLEVGSAGGSDACHLRAAGFDVIATDGTAGFVDYLRGHDFPDALRYDVRLDPPPTRDVDVIFANAVLPHLTRDETPAVLARLHEAYGDETVLVASVKIGHGEGWSTEKLGTSRWYTYWQPEDFTRTLMDAGWIVEEARIRAGRYDDWIGVIALPTRSALRDAFDERAADYGRSDWHRNYAEQLVAASPLVPGSHVLDVAAGTGFVAREAAARVGPSGSVTAVDISEGMLAELTRHCPPAPERAPIEPILGDAMALELPDGSVDAVLCGAGLLYMRPPDALREWHRVLRPGGFVAFSTMLTGEPPPGELFRLHARAYGLTLTNLSARLGTPEQCHDALTAAGFVDIVTTPGQVEFSEADMDRAWEIQQRMARAELATLPEEDVGRLRASYVAEVGLKMRTDPGFRIAKTLYAVARRP
jgi:ubiquinone/menaquinone biosynthesis C-methylase UbiE